MHEEPHWIMICNESFRARPEVYAEWLRRVQADPSDLDARVRLIGASFGSPDDAFHQARAENLIWLHSHRPDVDLAVYGTIDRDSFPAEYEQVRDHLVSLLTERDDDSNLIERLAKFMKLAEPREAALWFQRGASLAPERAWWRESLGDLWRREAKAAGRAEAVSLARRAWSEYELALTLSDNDFSRLSLLLTIGRAAYDAGETSRARQAAEQSLADVGAHEKTWIYGNVIHDANVVLGMLALDRGDTSAAEAHIEAAGATRGSPQLNSFGPDHTFAALLLAAGSREAVVRYFRACQRFWSMDGGRLQQWIEAIERGEQPCFDDRYRSLQSD